MLILVNFIWKFAFILGFGIGLAALLTWMERRQSAYSQDRLGPTRAHFFNWPGTNKPFILFGLLHVVADGAKMFFKEPVVPRGADRTLFLVAPLIGFVTVVVTLALIPFGPDISISVAALEGGGCPWYAAARDGACYFETPLQVATLDAGLLIVFAIGSLGVYAAALAGWSSNNRFGLLGGLRASAQSVSYEVALGLTVVGVLIAFGSTELGAIASAQDGLLFGFLPAWGVFLQPVGAALFFVAAIAETKRPPFDMPEGESEIVGFFLEYSSMGFALFLLSEFMEIVVLAMVFTVLFLGGWQMPYLIGENSVSLGFFTLEGSVWVAIAGTLVFMVKVFFLCALQLQIRWTLPRFRYDQVMTLGWKMLLPLAIVNIFVTAALVWWDPTQQILAYVSAAIIILFVLVVIAGPRRPAIAHEHGH
jgi:NADH-quinone oxidoreductase subunit H